MSTKKISMKYTEYLEDVQKAARNSGRISRNNGRKTVLENIEILLKGGNSDEIIKKVKSAISHYETNIEHEEEVRTLEIEKISLAVYEGVLNYSRHSKMAFLDELYKEGFIDAENYQLSGAKLLGVHNEV